MKKFKVTGMSCAACSARVESAVSSLDGVSSCSVNLLTGTMLVEGSTPDGEIISSVREAGYGASLFDGVTEKSNVKFNTDERKILVRLIISVVLLVPLMYFSMGHMVGLSYGALEGNYLAIGIIQLILSGACLIVNHKFFIVGVRGVIHLAPNMDTLVALGSFASYAYSTVMLIAMSIAIGGDGMAAGASYIHEFYFESAAMILVLITVGKMLEARAKGKTSDAIKSLMDLAPKTATVIVDGEERVINADDVKIGDIFVVRPGETVAVDGEIIDGSCALDESALTGESVPKDKSLGDKVYAATINKSGFITCRATSVGEGTALSNIIKMVSDATATKAPIAKIADKVSGIFVPVVIGIALISCAVWLISGAGFGFAIARGVSVLVISCPCALGLATPVAIMVGTGIGARRGVLFKNAEALERCGSVKTVLLDKTGTITEGAPRVTDVICKEGIDRNTLLECAYGVESGSEHPLALAIVNYCVQNGIKLPKITDFKAHVGSGVSCKIGNDEIIGGSFDFYRSRNAFADRADFERLVTSGKTPLYFMAENRLLGIIAVSDTVKSDSASAIAEITAMGAEVVMLTGDNEMTARAIADKVGGIKVIAGVLPDGKEAAVREARENGAVMMVGDGINDAPALAASDVGVAIGRGVDIAIESADVVLMRSTLCDAGEAMRLSRAVIRNIKQNLFWAFFYNCLGIPLAAGCFIPLFGWQLNPMFGAAAMSISSLFVVGNALRLNLVFPNLKRERGSEDLCDDGNTLILKISGMMCSHCERSVSDALLALSFITEAKADHVKKCATVSITGKVDENELRRAIEGAGYKLKKIIY